MAIKLIFFQLKFKTFQILNLINIVFTIVLQKVGQSLTHSGK